MNIISESFNALLEELNSLNEVSEKAEKRLKIAGGIALTGIGAHYGAKRLSSKYSGLTIKQAKKFADMHPVPHKRSKWKERVNKWIKKHKEYHGDKGLE